MRQSLSAISLSAAIALLGLTAAGQSTKGGSSAGASTTTSASPTTAPSFGSNTQVTDASWFLSGHVLLEDGTVPASRVDIESICNGRHHIEAHLDKKGEFSFRLGSPNNSVTTDAEDRSTRSAAPGHV